MNERSVSISAVCEHRHVILGLLIEFSGLFLVLIGGAYLLGKRSNDRLTRARIMVGALLLFFLCILAFFGYVAFVLDRKSTGTYLPIRATFQPLSPVRHAYLYPAQQHGTNRDL
jgi:uncharacterized membrane protein